MEGVSHLLATVAETVVMVSDEASLLETAGRLRPPLAVVDLSLSRSGNTRWLDELRARCPEMRLVILSVHDEPSVRIALLASGVDAFVLKRDVGTELLSAIERVLGFPSARAV